MVQVPQTCPNDFRQAGKDENSNARTPVRSFVATGQARAKNQSKPRFIGGDPARLPDGQVHEVSGEPIKRN